MKVVGLDLSINSTGVCINTKDDTKYYIIASDTSMSKKKRSEVENLNSNVLKYYIYDKKQPNSSKYSDKEDVKTMNLYNIISILSDIIETENPDYAVIEGVSYGSVGSAALVDLSGLNFMVRMMLEQHKIPFCILSPTENKKNATGNGGADKETMIYAWEACEPHMKVYDKYKIDDLADAYFLSCHIK